MALGIYFPVKQMSAEKYHDVHRRLDEIGQANPAGRSVHAGFRVGDEIHVFDVWESQEAFAAFGEHLMLILTELGIDAGDPQISEIEMLVTPAGVS